MPVTVTRLPDEPIILAHIYDRMDLATIRSMFEQTAALAQEIEGPLFRITNFRDVDVSIREMANALVEANRCAPGSTRDPRVTPIMVAGRNRVRLLFDAMKRKEFGGREVLVFDTLDEALSYARSQVRQSRLTTV
jgi:chromosome condensin MukBEF ATPase and DNA-binding subunit MukB